jgi:uncharacterized protein (DUF2147 family)
MRPRPVLAALAGGFIVAAAGIVDAAPAGPEGRWLTASGNVIVEVAPCGPDLCGTIVKLLANHPMGGASMPMPASTPGLGVKVMSGFRAAGAGRWVGHLYNRQNGKTYDCELSMPAPDQMKLRAYVLLPLIGQTQIWTRAG